MVVNLLITQGESDHFIKWSKKQHSYRDLQIVSMPDNSLKLLIHLKTVNRGRSCFCRLLHRNWQWPLKSSP
jgi:hypothetical protein